MTILECKRYMINEILTYPQLYVDYMTGEVNATTLAEDCANVFNLYEADPCQSSDVVEYLPADFLFDIAADIATDYEKDHS